MKLLNTIISEVFGLFVDDGSFAVAILAWIAATWLLVFKILAHPIWGGPLLFGGLVVILLESAVRRSRL